MTSFYCSNCNEYVDEDKCDEHFNGAKHQSCVNYELPTPTVIDGCFGPKGCGCDTGHKGTVGPPGIRHVLNTNTIWVLEDWNSETSDRFFTDEYEARAMASYLEQEYQRAPKSHDKEVKLKKRYYVQTFKEWVYDTAHLYY